MKNAGSLNVLLVGIIVSQFAVETSSMVCQIKKSNFAKHLYTFSIFVYFMMFSKTELELLSEVGRGGTSVNGIAKALHISISQVYRISQTLHQKGILKCVRGVLHSERKTHVSMFLNLLSRTKNLSVPFSGTGLQIYTAMIESKSVEEIEKETGLHKTTVLKKINQGRKMSLILREQKKYRVNEKLWSDAKEVLIEMKKFEDSVDERIPVGSVIYGKNEKEIVFSTSESIGAEETAFSAYEHHGLGLLLVKKYYVLPKRKLTKKEVFTHSLMVVEKEPETRYFIMIALFYIKYKKELARIHHRLIDNIKKVLAGEIVPGYPTLAEIKERASVYKIKVYYD